MAWRWKKPGGKKMEGMLIPGIMVGMAIGGFIIMTRLYGSK
ncbi:hypothetical protein [Methylosinus trichosporium]|nr:hypothetical protein [Methylosinus trichosporium]